LFPATYTYIKNLIPVRLTCYRICSFFLAPLCCLVYIFEQLFLSGVPDSAKA